MRALVGLGIAVSVLAFAGSSSRAEEQIGRSGKPVATKQSTTFGNPLGQVGTPSRPNSYIRSNRTGQGSVQPLGSQGTGSR